jgi:hypothetical protein
MSAVIGGRREASTLDSEIFPQFRGVAEQFRVLDATPGAALPLGTTRTDRPANITLLRAEPSQLVVVGAPWVASLLLLRAAVLGATAVIVTDRPAPWAQLVRRVGGVQPFAAVVPPDVGAWPTASAAAPLFVLYDGASGENQLARAPWSTAAHLVPRLTPALGSLLDAADLVLVPRPAPDEADTAIELLRLPPAIMAQFERMTPTELLTVTRHRALFVTITPTAAESSLLSGGG